MLKRAPVQSIIVNGAAGILVDIECRLSNNLPTIVIVGSANRAVGESKERIRGAFATSHIMLPRKRITVNLAPADVPKGDSGFDLAIAVAILVAGGEVRLPAGERPAFIGELGLDGSTRPVRGIIGKLLAGRARGITTFYIPAGNRRQAELVPHVRLVPVANLAQLYAHLADGSAPTPLDTGDGTYPEAAKWASTSEMSLSAIIGQIQAKRALEIAAAGGHNLLFDGPPGTGKTLLGKALPGLLPPLTQEEILEVTQLHSLARHDYGRLVTERPFRAPHHSASMAAVTGGGARLRPGEMSLAHRGVLLFDELPEFNRETLEALRQPLENRIISVARAQGAADYPAHFIFVATANPCPCGYYGYGRPCSCSPGQVTSYRNRLSGPVLDRIDLRANVHEIEYGALLTQPADPVADEGVRRRVLAARQRQAERFGSRIKLNTDMTNTDIRQLLHLEPEALSILNEAAHTLRLSTRGYLRTIKVAQTIADLHASPVITGAHLADALSYRPDLRVRGTGSL